MGVFENKEYQNHEHVSFVEDEKNGLRAIIAIHSTVLGGRSGGGCRFFPYPDSDAALTDVLRLSRAMTNKFAIAGLPAGGGKTVIIGDPKKDKSEALLEALGRFIDRLGGRYVIAEDVGTTPEDMAVINRKTPFVTGLPGQSGDTSPATGEGIYNAIRAAADYKLKRKVVSVAMQGFGNVGRYLAGHLVENGVKLYVTDINQDNVRLAVEKFGAIAVGLEEIFSLNVDVLAPCALGAVLNDHTIPQIKAPVICGGANNQLAESRHAQMLQDKGILFVPDYVANAGGAIAGAAPVMNRTIEETNQAVAQIYNNCFEVLKIADSEGITPDRAAAKMADKIIKNKAAAQ